MFRRMIPRFGLPFGGGIELVMLGGAAYFAWEHEQGRHAQAHLLCPICWLNRIAPAPEAPGETQPDESQAAAQG